MRNSPTDISPEGGILSKLLSMIFCLFDSIAFWIGFELWLLWIFSCFRSFFELFCIFFESSIESQLEFSFLTEDDSFKSQLTFLKKSLFVFFSNFLKCKFESVWLFIKYSLFSKILLSEINRESKIIELNLLIGNQR